MLLPDTVGREGVSVQPGHQGGGIGPATSSHRGNLHQELYWFPGHLYKSLNDHFFPIDLHGSLSDSVHMEPLAVLQWPKDIVDVLHHSLDKRPHHLFLQDHLSLWAAAEL